MDMQKEHLENIPDLPAIFGPARQVAYIVPEIDAAMDHWRSLEIGPFLVTRDVSPLQNAYYRGEKSGPTPVHIAFAYHGDMQLELIEPLHKIPSIYSEAVERNTTGIHHYAVCVDDFAAAYQFATAEGYVAVVDSGVDGLARMSYMEHLETEIILEVIEWNDLTRPYFETLSEMWKEANAKNKDVEFVLADLTPKMAILSGLGRFIIKKLTGQVKKTRQSA